MFKEAPKVVLTGLTKVIGNPREFGINLNEEAYFSKDINITIPMDETNEYTKYHVENMSKVKSSL